MRQQKCARRIQKLSDASLAELRQINTAWAKNPAEQIEGFVESLFRVRVSDSLVHSARRNDVSVVASLSSLRLELNRGFTREANAAVTAICRHRGSTQRADPQLEVFAYARRIHDSRRPRFRTRIVFI